MGFRYEQDTLGKVAVPEDKLWGAQTQRSLEYFNIGTEKFSIALIRALVLIKKAAAVINHQLGQLDQQCKNLIIKSCDEILAGKHADQFPLSIWQTGSGTQTNMNVNEVIANRANELVGSKRGSKSPVHPNDHVNMSQSSNDAFPTAMHIAITIANQQLLVNLDKFIESLKKKAGLFKGKQMVGRTHLMDALPVTVDQILLGYSHQLIEAKQAITSADKFVCELAIGGTAVGTGANAPKNFGSKMAQQLSKYSGMHFTSHPNKFAALSAEDAVVRYSAALKQLATVLLKIANDIRLLASGPRCGIGEWIIPANEPGSSIMPGKVNPTQCEALSMITVQIMANDLAVSLAGSQGHLQLNTYRPLIIHNILQSQHLLTDGMSAFTQHCIAGLAFNETVIAQHNEQNLMLITLLAPKIGYDKAAKIAKLAADNNLSLTQAAVKLKLYSASNFNRLLNKAQ